MPHKKAKHSVRKEQQRKQGSNLAPGKDSISSEAIPKSAARIINASQIREIYKKRTLEQGENEGRNPQKRQKINKLHPEIKPGESIQHFYRRVEDDMRPLVRSAVQASKAVERKARNAEVEPRKKNTTRSRGSNAPGLGSGNERPARLPESSSLASGPGDPKVNNAAERPKEFEKLSTSAPRRLNDVAQAPPEIQKSIRSIKKVGLPKREGVLSMAQKSMMEQEREKAIVRYRMLKASRQP